MIFAHRAEYGRIQIPRARYPKNCMNMATVPRTIERKGSLSGFVVKSFAILAFSLISE